MTIRERMMAVYRYHAPDQVPVSIYAQYLPRGSTERMVRGLGLGILDYVPLTTLLAPPWHTHAGFVSEVQGAEFDICFTWENGQKHETRIDRPPGHADAAHPPGPTYGSDWTEKFYLSSPADYKIMQYIVEHTVLRKNEEAFLTRQEDMRGGWVPVPDVEAVDTTGSGDIFNGAFMAAFSRGKTLEECIQFANCAASIPVTRLGVVEAIPELDDVLSSQRVA